jgi:hypothetical protein
LANLSITALEKLQAILLTGANEALASIAARDGTYWKPLEDKSVVMENIPADLADQNRSVVYPAVYIYCVRMENLQRRKFSGGFAGPIHLVADVRCSGERYTGLESALTSYVEAVTTGLARNVGSWGENLAFSGAYTVKFDPVRPGGRNFIQSAKVELQVEACG